MISGIWIRLQSFLLWQNSEKENRKKIDKKSCVRQKYARFLLLIHKMEDHCHGKSEKDKGIIQQYRQRWRLYKLYIIDSGDDRAMLTKIYHLRYNKENYGQIAKILLEM